MHFLRLIFVVSSLFCVGIASAINQQGETVSGPETKLESHAAAQPAAAKMMPASPQNAAEKKQIPQQKLLPVTQNKIKESESQYWHSRVETLLEEIDRGEKTSEDADVLYHKLSEQLRNKRHVLRLALNSANSPSDIIHETSKSLDIKATTAKKTEPITVEYVHTTMVNLYQSRTLLLDAISPTLKTQITSTGVAGMEKFNGEMEYMLLYLSFHAMAIPQILPQLFDMLTAAPIPVIWEFLKLLMSVLVFYWWRQWATDGLVKFRGRILQAKPRTQRRIKFARLVWYFQQVRSPLEWLLLISIIFNLIAWPSLLVIEDFFRIILSWIMLAWFAVRLINAIALRRVAGLSDDTSGLRLRSIKLLAGWVLILGLGLSLTETYTGQGTTYAMVWLLFEILSIPVIILLLTWWKREIAHELVDMPALPAWVEDSLEKRKGMQNYINVLIGAMYLVFVYVRQLSLRQLAKFEGGRELLVALLGRDVSDKQEQKMQALGSKAISQELRKQLLNSEGNIVDKIYSKEIKSIAEFVEFGRKGVVGLISERGLGKSLLLSRLAEKFDDKAITVQCTMQGFDGVMQVFSEKFSIPTDQLTPARMVELIESNDIRFIAIDDLHLLVRPKMGGQVELDRLSDFIGMVTSNVSWIVTMDKPAYQYAHRLRPDRSILEQVIELPPWSQKQISSFIEMRCQQAGIEPDFSYIVIPHQYDEEDYDTLEERTHAGFYRILSSLSGGNPAVAIRLWTDDALTVTADNRYVVQIPSQVFESDQLENASLSILLMLRVIIQSGRTTAEDIVDSLLLPSGVIDNCIRFALYRDWIEDLDGYYQIRWRWFRAINRELARKNLLAR